MSTDAQIRFHFSLNVRDLSRSATFYRKFLGVEPSKERSDYAKFEIDNPPIVLSLEPSATQPGGVLNHLGLRMNDAPSLVAMQARLEAAGLPSQREEGVECCYAKQTKFWMHDPDGVLWEVYTFDGDIEDRGMGQTQDAVGYTAPTSTGMEWEHRMGQPIPERIPMDDDAATEVRLRGTFNLAESVESRAQLLNEVVRVLGPGGRLFIHVLTGEQAVDGPELQGPASVVQHVPTKNAIVELLEGAKLERIHLLKYNDKPCFVRNGVAMRETQIEAYLPG